MKVKDLMEQCKTLVENGYGDKDVTVMINQFDILSFDHLMQDVADDVFIYLNVTENFKDWIKGTFIPYGERDLVKGSGSNRQHNYTR